MLVPVLALDNPEAACQELAEHFGFHETGPGVMALGNQRIVLAAIGMAPQGMLPLRIDHVALSVADADQSQRRYSAQGAQLDRRFTPDGPRDIPEFWEHGARFVFFRGPAGWPLEFCARTGLKRPGDLIGHDHFGVRISNIEESVREFSALGAELIAEHQLVNAGSCVNVRFLRWHEVVIELFDEAPFAEEPYEGGWIGLLDT